MFVPNQPRRLLKFQTYDSDLTDQLKNIHRRLQPIVRYVSHEDLILTVGEHDLNVQFETQREKEVR